MPQPHPQAVQSPTRAGPAPPRPRIRRRVSAGSTPRWTARRQPAGCARGGIAGPPSGRPHATGAAPCRPGRRPSWPHSGPPAMRRTHRRRPRWPARWPTPSARISAAPAPPSPADGRARRSSGPTPGRITRRDRRARPHSWRGHRRRRRAPVARRGGFGGPWRREILRRRPRRPVRRYRAMRRRRTASPPCAGVSAR